MTSRHQTHDRLLARVRLTDRRLTRLATALDDETPYGHDLRDRIDMLTARCAELADDLRHWTEVEVGMLTAVEDLGAAVDALDADLAASDTDERSGYEEAVDRQVRTWRSRIDRLRLHGHLGSLEARDELDALVDRLEEARAMVFEDLHDAADDSQAIVTDLRADVEKVLVDLRNVVEHAAAALSRG